MNKYLAESIGAFALVFCGTGAIIIDQETGGGVGHIGVAITFGLIISAMIYSLGEISGAHFNPAVTIAFHFARRFPVREIAPYIFAQITGAVLASIVLRLLFPSNEWLGVTQPAQSAAQSFVMEWILTFILMFVIIQVSTGSKEQGMFAGIAVGSVVLLEAMFAGPISGASMNPARSMAPAIASGHLENLWIYLLAPVGGAVSAVVVWKILKPTSAAIQK